MTRALVMGVLNVTPDSFSDGGQFFDVRAAVERGQAMFSEGADIVDVGGESTRPHAAGVPSAEELRRVLPVVEALARHGRISIDTTKSEVARAAVVAGATMINDVSAALGAVAGELGVAFVAMHRKGTPATMQADPRYDDVVAEVGEYLSAKAREAEAEGVREVWVDPGIGFGKTLEHNVALLAATRSLSDLGHSVVVGVSRKSFLGVLARSPSGDVPSPENRGEASVAAGLWAVEQGASMLRVHDVAATVQALRILSERVEW
ncbi:MAG TPA: dihydropteroate synthase [Acidimicrobiales bacterium]|nr:dihydropteroate synthase [Acidimicrobiales bacterium]